MRFFLGSALLLCVSSVSAQGLSVQDVLALQSVRDVYTGAGDAVLFTRSVPRPMSQGPGSARTHLFAWAETGARALVDGDASIRGVALHPDGKRFSFLARREGDTATQVWAQPIAGGDEE